MKNLVISLLFIGLISSCRDSGTNNEKPLSPHATAMSMVGGVHIHIDYSSPGARGRKIFGELVPYGKLWRAGAGEATWIETNRDIIIEGKILPAGKYGFFAIPNDGHWTLIFNSRWKQHGAQEYNESEDILRVDVAPKIEEKHREHLLYEVVKNDSSSGVISLSWENSIVEIYFDVEQQKN